MPDLSIHGTFPDLSTHGIFLERVDRPDRRTYLTLWIAGQRFERVFNLVRNDEDWRDWRVANSYWRHGHMVDELGPMHEQAALIDRCLAIETLFPHVRDLLPA